MQFRFPFLIDPRNTAEKVDIVIGLHHLRRTRNLEDGIVSVLREVASLSAICHVSALDRKYPFIGRKVHKQFMPTHFPNLDRIEILNLADIHQLFVPESQQIIDGQIFKFDSMFYDESLYSFVLQYGWVKKVLIAARTNVTTFTLWGLRFSDDFAHDLALMPQVEELELKIYGPVDGKDNDNGPEDKRAWRDRLSALPGLVSLRLAFQCQWDPTVSDWVFEERHFPYLEDVLPKSSKLRKFSSDNWRIRHAALCDMIEMLGPEQEVAFEDLPINLEATGVEFSDAPRAIMLQVVTV